MAGALGAGTACKREVKINLTSFLILQTCQFLHNVKNSTKKIENSTKKSLFIIQVCVTIGLPNKSVGGLIMEKILMVVPLLGVIALAFAAMLAARVNKQEPGTDRMKEIAAAISEGAQAFLTAEYKILLIFGSCALCIDRSWNRKLGDSNLFCGGSFVLYACRIFWNERGDKSECKNRKCAKQSGMNKALSIAFSGGAVYGNVRGRLGCSRRERDLSDHRKCRCVIGI